MSKRFTNKLKDNTNELHLGDKDDQEYYIMKQNGTYSIGGEAIDKFAHYEDLEEQGRLIDLPCKVGDTVFSIENAGDVDNEKWIIEPFKIMSLHHIAQLIENNKFGEDYGVFLTRTEAEAKLKEMRGE